jgi:(1->4)-alpha-D-glucan 1-alpha-D-glucosylmutase
MLTFPARVPRATYRLQLNSDFTFEDSLRLVPYLKRLGISDVYASPIFQASSKSTHGYDVNDFTRISTDLGGRDGLERLSEKLREEGLGLLLDFVPNHMGIDGTNNLWWFHVLENGAKSKYAPYFDIEWHPRLDRLNDRVLVPILGDYYGAVLERGELAVRYEEGRFVLNYGSRKLPVSPETYALILDQVDRLLEVGDSRKIRLREWGDAFESLPSQEPEECDKQLAALKLGFADAVRHDPQLLKLFQAALKIINGTKGERTSFEFLHDLLERQHYRLAHWKVGAHEVNYRRFFAVDTLIGLRMEKVAVFEATHALLAELIGSRVVTGIRLDHIDGLWNPSEYLDRLKTLVGSLCDQETIYTLVEKILAPGEDLPRGWAVHGTTGYEFAASLIELFLDRGDERAWTQHYEKFVGDDGKSNDQTYHDKMFILREMFPNAVSNLAVELDSLIEADWRRRDISLHDLKTALRHFLACLSVYRTYRMPGEEMVREERERILCAVEEAIRRNPCVDPIPVRFVGLVTTGDYPAPEESPERKESFGRWVAKLQQITGAIMAKSVEDTHFYRYVRMLGTNEVGSHPSRFGQPVSTFHEANKQRLKNWPLCLLTTSTHDTKMSEDARARLFALAELPDEWAANLHTWHELNADARTEVTNRTAPDSREEYLLYQALLAAWPLGMVEVDDEFVGRMKAYFRKAQGEAKLNTAWTYPHAKWHEAGDQFIETILRSSSFLNSFLPFAQQIAKRGMIFALSQTVLKLSSPGVPDIYQGNETWDFSLVDPDNRRPIDYPLRETILTSLGSRSVVELLQNWQDGGIKMHITQALLRLRSEIPDLFTKGEYVPLPTQGEKADQIVAYVRKLGSTELLIVAPRQLSPGNGSYLGPYWGNTGLVYPQSRTWESVLTTRSIGFNSGFIPLSSLLTEIPVAAYVSDGAVVRESRSAFAHDCTE